MVKATIQAKKQASVNDLKVKPVGKNGKLPSAKTLLKNYTPIEILDMFTGDEMVEIFTGNQLLAMAMQIRESYETKNRKRKRVV
jgi:hypothetical protein